MKIILSDSKKASLSKNLFFALFEKETLEKNEVFLILPNEKKQIISRFLKSEFEGKEGETNVLWFPEGIQIAPQRVVLFGLGDKTKWNERKKHLVPRIFVQYAKANKIEEFATTIEKLDVAPERQEGNTAEIFSKNAILADFVFNKYKEKPKDGWPTIKNIYLASRDSNNKNIKKGLEEGIIIGEETNACRELSNTPGGDMTPKRLANNAKIVSQKNKLQIKILGEKEMQKLGMGGILGVSKGSTEEAQFIIIEYNGGPKSQKPLVLAGKGVTFDTGGLNLKPSQAIYEMHMDMSGGAAVIHGIIAIKRLQIPINAVAIVPAVENMPSGSSYHPGDLLKTMSGKTIEVLDTDAEGRVILSDALYYGAKKYNPGLMVDFATLTGAAHVALGDYCSALFTNREKIQNNLFEIGRTSGDYVWPLPLWDEYLPDIIGTFGDVANIGRTGRSGGAIHGAKFLEQFVENTPWAHIDIAPRMTTTEGEYLSKGAAGAGVRYIVQLAKEYAQIISKL